jgi:hypothetical protein
MTATLGNPFSLQTRRQRLAAIVVATALAGMAMWGHISSNGPASAKGAALKTASMNRPMAMNPPAPLELSTLPVRPVKRNLFSLRLEDYPAASAAHGVGEENLAIAAKSSVEPADLTMEGQILPANLRRAAEGLRLQGTVLGTAPTAVVNGQVVKEGDEIAGFKIVRIEPGGIVVEKDDVRVRVQANDE